MLIKVQISLRIHKHTEPLLALYNTWVKVFRIIPVFRILRHRKSASKCWILLLIIAFLILLQLILRYLTIKLGFFLYFGGIQQVLNSDFLKFKISEILNFHQWQYKLHSLMNLWVQIESPMINIQHGEVIWTSIRTTSSGISHLTW